MLKRILIDLDTLLDTRLGVINTINPEAAKYIAKSNDYWDRENDFWEVLTGGLVTREQFDVAWSERGGNNSADVINSSVITDIVPLVMKLLGEDLVNRANLMGDELDMISIAVNTWPYALSLDEKEDMRDIATYLFGETTPIEIIDVPMSYITPTYLDEHFAAVITYNFLEWIRMHHADLGKARMNCFNFIGPRIFEKDVSKLTIDEKKTILDVFRLEKLIHMDFEFIDARHFSMLRLEKKKKSDIEASP